jgi:hypothetical protein
MYSGHGGFEEMNGFNSLIIPEHVQREEKLRGIWVKERERAT